MMHFHLKLTRKQIAELEESLSRARFVGRRAEVDRIRGVLAFARGESSEMIASILCVCEATVHNWVGRYLARGVAGLATKSSPGRPSKLSKTDKRALAKLIDEGPAKAGFPGSCWRSPMIQDVIKKRFNVFYSVTYISQLLRNMGYSFQKARFAPDRKNDFERSQWLTKTWPGILATAKRKNALVLFGDEASFPQWGSLSYTWARKGHQPVVATCGKRRSYKVLGLIDYFSGSFFHKAVEGRLTSAMYAQFLREVLLQTDQHLIIIQDGAPYHKSAAMQAFFKEHEDRITVERLPAYSPDFNPIEMLWKKIKQDGTHLTYFPTFDDLKGKVRQTLRLFADARSEVLALFGLYNDRAATA